MSFWTAAVIVVAIVAFAAMKIVRYNTQGHGRHDAAPSAETSDAERREIEELRERIKVLERIATDGNTLDTSETRRISAEIEALREKQG